MGEVASVFSKIADESNSLKTIDKVHHEIHEGEMFLSHLSTTGTSTTHYFIMQTPDTAVRAHMNGQVSADIGGRASLYEDASVSSSYTAITPYNKDRNSDSTSFTLTGVAPTSSYIASIGTLLESVYFGNAKPGRLEGGESGDRNEWILKQNTTYLVSYVSSAAANVNYNIEWYEENR